MIKVHKPRVAFFDFAGCEGCQLTVVDALQCFPDLLEAVEIVQFREAMSEKGDDYTVAFVEGSYTRESDLKRLQEIRAQAKILVALGACAHTGGINALRNHKNMDEARRYVYGARAGHIETGQVHPISEAVSIDAFIPGCPIDRQEFILAVKTLLQGRLPDLPDYPVCVECKLRENACLFYKDKVCFGPVTRAGCGAICPTLNVGCEGCRGLIPNPNLESLEGVMLLHGCGQAQVRSISNLFMTCPQKTEEVNSDGS